jgi:hypothetical protein
MSKLFVANRIFKPIVELVASGLERTAKLLREFDAGIVISLISEKTGEYFRNLISAIVLTPSDLEVLITVVRKFTTAFVLKAAEIRKIKEFIRKLESTLTIVSQIFRTISVSTKFTTSIVVSLLSEEVVKYFRTLSAVIVEVASDISKLQTYHRILSAVSAIISTVDRTFAISREFYSSLKLENIISIVVSYSRNFNLFIAEIATKIKLAISLAPIKIKIELLSSSIKKAITKRFSTAVKLVGVFVHYTYSEGYKHIKFIRNHYNLKRLREIIKNF